MVEQKAKLQQQEAAPKRTDKTRMAAPKCATQKKIRNLCRTESIYVKYFKEQQTVERQTVELRKIGFERSRLCGHDLWQKVPSSPVTRNRSTE